MLSLLVTILIVVLREINILMLAIIIYNFNASTARVTLLYFIKLIYIILLVKVNYVSPTILVSITNIKPICELRSLLLIKEPFTKT